MTLYLRVVAGLLLLLLLLERLCLIEGLFVLLQGLTCHWLVQVETDLLCGVGVFVGFGSDAPVTQLLLLLSSSQFIISVHHF